MVADISSMKVDELKQLAREAGIAGTANMKKADLIEALEKPIESAKESQPVVEKPGQKKSSQVDIDYANHPKFHKFKGTGKKEHV